MGCCYSTNKPSPPKTTKLHTPTTISKSPPPTSPLHVEQEETVKEVLSETPSSLVPKPPIHRAHARSIESPFIKVAPLLRGIPNKDHHKPFMADDLSDVSEICSTHSESLSAPTSARDTKPELRQLRQSSPSRFKNRSFSGEMNREKTVGRSPARRPHPSPNRVRPNGESSGRRSRSPVTRAGLDRTPSARKTGKSPGRVRSGLGERIRKVDGGKEESGDSKWPPTTSNELLENPLVSLECFIFL